MDGWNLFRPEARSLKGLGTLNTYNSSVSAVVSHKPLSGANYPRDTRRVERREEELSHHHGPREPLNPRVPVNLLAPESNTCCEDGVSREILLAGGMIGVGCPGPAPKMEGTLHCATPRRKWPHTPRERKVCMLASGERGILGDEGTCVGCPLAPVTVAHPIAWSSVASSLLPGRRSCGDFIFLPFSSTS
jgi:hypothetical protein